MKVHIKILKKCTMYKCMIVCLLRNRKRLVFSFQIIQDKVILVKERLKAIWNKFHRLLSIEGWTFDIVHYWYMNHHPPSPYWLFTKKNKWITTKVAYRDASNLQVLLIDTYLLGCCIRFSCTLIKIYLQLVNNDTPFPPHSYWMNEMTHIWWAYYQP